MATIRIRQFRGIAPAVNARLLENSYAQVAHNTLLRDGVLRPYAKWQFIHSWTSDQRSIHHNKTQDNIEYSYLSDAVKLTGAPFPPNGFIGVDIDSDPSVLQIQNLYLNLVYNAGVHYECTFDISASAQGLSLKPVSRAYAYTSLRYNGVGYEEGPLTLLPPNVEA